MLQAMNQNGYLLTPALLEPHKLEKLKQNSFSCPHCKEHVIMKTGKYKIPHFAHYAKSACPSSSSGEGEYHEHGKLDLYYWLKNQGVDVRLEVYLPTINQRPDLLFQIGSKTIVVEYQCARISHEEFIHRNKGYKRLNIHPIWILGGNRMKRKGEFSLQTNASDYKFLHQFSKQLPLTFYFYCPKTKDISIVHSIQATGKNVSYAQFQFQKLTRLKLADLWRYNGKSNYQLLQIWKIEKERLRTKPLRSYSSKQRQWNQWLYLQHLHPSLLPSIVHLPVRGQFIMNSPPWIWQSRLVLNLFQTPYKQVTKQMCDCLIRKDKLPPSYFPLVKPVYDPVLEYLHLLVQLNYLHEESPITYKLVKEIPCHHHINRAIDADHRLLEQLMNSGL
ncbi:competence protein CoiA [Aquibacillus sediminis]|uniref:competence protein CoiA n=1 Tax=Aquibacillus sediminis TaxID=2574734 RepID=UPI0011092ECA|nr:competence protein CoiA family protein [Aquibacillus sediminis]